MKRLPLIALVGALGGSLYLLSAKGHTYLIHFCLWTVAFTVCAASIKQRAGRIICLNLALLCALFAFLEGALWLKSGLSEGGSFYRIKPHLARELNSDHPVLGWAPEPGRRYEARKTRGEQVLYDVYYTIDENGFRITPPPNRENAPAILFTGCSFTFGEGLNDEESFPYRVAQKLDGRYKICNLAYSGYGAQQTLANIRHGLYKKALGDSQPLAMIHLSIPDHADRAVGALSWGQRAPRFFAGSDGRLETNGTFENSGTTGEWLRYVRLKEAEKSELGKRLFSYRTSDEDIELWIELLKSARREFQDSFPETPFIVVLLNSPTPTTQKMEEALKKSGLTYHLCYSESPDLREEKYKIPVDRHPNALGAEKLADYMINFPLKDVLKNR